MMIDALTVFQNLKSGVSTRQAKSLSILNEVLKSQHDRGVLNFSIAEVARLSVARGGPSAQTIRNKTGLVFRQLIEAWATQAGMTMKAPIDTPSKANRSLSDTKLLERIPDPALRALFGQIIAERNRYRNELNILKSQSEVIVDKRPVKKVEPPLADVQLLPALRLNDMEIEALAAAISNDFFYSRRWSVTHAGQVKDENRCEIYKHGYVKAIEKILKELTINQQTGMGSGTCTTGESPV